MSFLLFFEVGIFIYKLVYESSRNKINIKFYIEGCDYNFMVKIVICFKSFKVIVVMVIENRFGFYKVYFL